MREDTFGVVVGWFVVIAIVAMILVAFMNQTSAQTRPYVAYPVYAGCLYITPQGYAVIGQMVPGGSCQ